jgi:hypothetical protein
MTVPPGLKSVARKVSDVVREMIPRHRVTLTPEEQTVGIYLRGNKDLYESLRDLIESRIGGRANLSVPSNPIDCKAILDRDHELRWLLNRLAFIYSAPVAQPTDSDGEQPA